ncbi:hypothetical protein GCM10010404_81850 [Nonomuraea africana]|uniref:S-DNA-T family DNA segregation ATPase FtsK/SpoIIIE n=1 Tax=Nonomuraea africana TaxID=46171 RepID=A0ABR9KXT4_9ACTN|nr:hypothetical protein [Nonomuraea africana]MBE1566580.1 S-DNA-T family DNA segregation ATPase FtsK/SpoIIIE [Nonomuraea africana]
MATTPQRNGRRPSALQGALSAAAQANATLAATGALADTFGFHPLWGAAGTVAAAGATVLANAQAAPSALLYRLACWCGAGTWLTWVLATDMWQPSSFATLGIGTLAAVLGSPLAHRERQRLEASVGRGALVLSSTSRLAQDWERRVLLNCHFNVRIEEVRWWPGRTGYDLLTRIETPGRTRADLERGADTMATNAKLPNGCGIEVTKGPDRGSAWMRVGIVNRLAETIPYPEDFSPTSFLDPKTLGEYRDGSPVQVVLRQKAGLITGQRGSGKTMLQHVLTCEAGRSRDAIVIHIDLNGGGLSQPWLDPWIEGDIDRCPLGWAASNIDEALLVSRAMLAIAKDRKRSTRRIKKAANSQLLPISVDLPAYKIIVDESAEAMGQTSEPRYAELRSNLAEIQRIGRNEAIEVDFSGLRATQDVIPVNVKKQSSLRIGMFVQDTEEISYLFGWGRGLSLEDLDGPGCGFIQFDQEKPRPFKAAFMDFLQITRAAVAISRIRPDFDPAAERAARSVIGAAFDTRFERMRVAFTEHNEDDYDEAGEEEGRAQLPAVRTPAPAPAVPGRDFTLIMGGNMADWPHPSEIAAAMANQPAQAAVRIAPGVLPAPAEAPELIRRAMAVFHAEGDDRIHSEDLAAALGFPNKYELAAALAPYGVTARPNAFLKGGQRRRGYDLADFTTATQRDQQGSAEGPPSALAGPHNPHVGDPHTHTTPTRDPHIHADQAN